MSADRLYYGIRGIANDWIKSYLMNRKQFVSINGFHSSTNIMKFGVTQGSQFWDLNYSF